MTFFCMPATRSTSSKARAGLDAATAAPPPNLMLPAAADLRMADSPAFANRDSRSLLRPALPKLVDGVAGVGLYWRKGRGTEGVAAAEAGVAGDAAASVEAGVTGGMAVPAAAFASNIAAAGDSVGFDCWGAKGVKEEPVEGGTWKPEKRGGAGKDESAAAVGAAVGGGREKPNGAANVGGGTAVWPGAGVAAAAEPAVAVAAAGVAGGGKLHPNLPGAAAPPSFRPPGSEKGEPAEEGDEVDGTEKEKRGGTTGAAVAAGAADAPRPAVVAAAPGGVGNANPRPNAVAGVPAAPNRPGADPPNPPKKLGGAAAAAGIDGGGGSGGVDEAAAAVAAAGGAFVVAVVVCVGAASLAACLLLCVCSGLAVAPALRRAHPRPRRDGGSAPAAETDTHRRCVATARGDRWMGAAATGCDREACAVARLPAHRLGCRAAAAAAMVAAARALCVCAALQPRV